MAFRLTDEQNRRAKALTKAQAGRMYADAIRTMAATKDKKTRDAAVEAREIALAAPAFDRAESDRLDNEFAQEQQLQIPPMGISRRQVIAPPEQAVPGIGLGTKNTVATKVAKLTGSQPATNTSAPGPAVGQVQQQPPDPVPPAPPGAGVPPALGLRHDAELDAEKKARAAKAQAEANAANAQQAQNRVAIVQQQEPPAVKPSDTPRGRQMAQRQAALKEQQLEPEQIAWKMAHTIFAANASDPDAEKEADLARREQAWRKNFGSGPSDAMTPSGWTAEKVPVLDANGNVSGFQTQIKDLSGNPVLGADGKPMTSEGTPNLAPGSIMGGRMTKAGWESFTPVSGAPGKAGFVRPILSNPPAPVWSPNAVLQGQINRYGDEWQQQPGESAQMLIDRRQQMVRNRESGIKVTDTGGDYNASRTLQTGTTKDVRGPYGHGTSVTPLPQAIAVPNSPPNGQPLTQLPTALPSFPSDNTASLPGITSEEPTV